MPTLLSPLFLIGALAAAIPVVLHLLEREPEPRVRFAAVELLKGAPVAFTERRRIRELLLLALRVAAILLLALAFARPFLASAALPGSAGATIVALDTSYSMSAPGAFDRAKRLAKDAIAQAPGDLVGVVTFADRPAVVASLGSGPALARSAIDAAAPGVGSTAYRAALGAAAQALGGRAGAIVVVTDLQESGWDAGDRVSVPENVRVEVRDVGVVRTNVAVTAIRVEGDRVVASVRNSGDGVRETTVRLTLDDRPAGVAGVAVGPRATAEVVFSGASNRSSAVVTIEDRDGLAADNVRYAVVNGAGRQDVLVVTSNGDLARDAFYLQQALLSGEAGGGRSYQPVAVTPAQLSARLPAQLSHAAVMLLSTRGLERRGREALAGYVTAGGGLFVAVGPDVDGAVVADVLGPQATLRIAAAAAAPLDRSLIPMDVRHPVLQAFGSEVATLGLVTFHQVARIEGVGCQAIARFTTGEAAILDCEAGEGRAMVIASDLDRRWSDFPMRSTFVPFVHETLRFLSGKRSHRADYLVGDVPQGVPPTPGFAVRQATGADGGPTRVAVNVDPRESDLARLSAEEFQAAVTRLKAAGAVEARIEDRGLEDRQHLWMYALGLTLAVLAVEGIVASRTG